MILDVGDADIVLAPITTKSRSTPGDCKLSDWSGAGLLAESWVRLAKIACLEKADIVRPMGKLTSNDKNKVKNEWLKLYKL